MPLRQGSIQSRSAADSDVCLPLHVLPASDWHIFLRGIAVPDRRCSVQRRRAAAIRTHVRRQQEEGLRSFLPVVRYDGGPDLRTVARVPSDLSRLLRRSERGRSFQPYLGALGTNRSGLAWAGRLLCTGASNTRWHAAATIAASDAGNRAPAP